MNSLKNVSKVRISKEATDQVRQPLKRSHVTQHDFSKLFATPDRPLPDSMVLQVVPDVFVGIQIGCVRRQEEKPKASVRRSYELEHLLGAVRWMAIDDQKHWAGCVVDQALEELDERRCPRAVRASPTR